MMNTGRNQPCPCGSGRKYKHCCSGTRTGASSPHTNGSARGAIRIPPDVIAGYDWQADIFPVPVSFESDPHARPTALLVTANELVLAQEMFSAPLAEVDEIAAKLAKGIDAGRLATGVAPPAVVVRWEELAHELRARLPDDVPVRVTPVLEDLEVAARSLLTHVANFPHWPVVSNPDSWLGWGLLRPLIAELFDAAADFYRARPWRILDDVPPLTVRLRGDRIWTVALMGAGGQEYGVAMYNELYDYLRTITSDDGEEAAASLTGRTIALGFARGTDLPQRIQREVASNGWRVAAPDAYPILMPMNTPAGGISRQDARDLIAVLRAVPAFVEEHGHLFDHERTPSSAGTIHEPTGATVLYDAEFPWLDELDPEDDELDADDLDDNFIDPDDLLDLNEFGHAAAWLRGVFGSRARGGGRAAVRASGSRSRDGRTFPPKGSAEAVAAVLDHAFAWITAYGQRDPAATEALSEGAKHLLREYAQLEPDEISRVLKPEAWAAGALHAAFQLGSTAVRSAAQLADLCGVSSSAVNARSRRLREAVEWPGEVPSRQDDRPFSLWPEAEPKADARTAIGHRDERATKIASDDVAADTTGAIVLPFVRRGSEAGEERSGGAGATREEALPTQRAERTTDFTPLQGQYLTYIHYYTKLHRRPPSEVDLRDYFRVTAPTVHNMILTLERKGLISRVPRQARSIRVLVDRELLPELE